jgi:AcrR family transcriptional regulator
MSTEPLTHRRRQALETRARIVRAARAVFAEQGYGAATIAGVAEAAGVAQPTVYKLFRNKRALLTAIADEWIGQVGIGQLQPAASPREAIAGWAATIRRQWELGLDIGLVYAGAVTS